MYIHTCTYVYGYVCTSCGLVHLSLCASAYNDQLEPHRRPTWPRNSTCPIVCLDARIPGFSYFSIFGCPFFCFVHFRICRNFMCSNSRIFWLFGLTPKILCKPKACQRQLTWPLSHVSCMKPFSSNVIPPIIAKTNWPNAVAEPSPMPWALFFEPSLTIAPPPTLLWTRIGVPAPFAVQKLGHVGLWQNYDI